ncbi:adhesin [Streptomyces sp. NBC_00829]|uniref:adhesin n=1 Tax=Streptomyces sp. NBC_00829 TaxID=2903679 RepID=UPI003868BC21|nr:adhesin [Streptomyces sp. NBC_00829]
MAGNTLAGRVSRLSRTGKILLAAGAVLSAFAVTVTAVTLSEGDSAATGAGTPDNYDLAPGDLGGAPQRIVPTALPSITPAATPSPDPSDSRGAKTPGDAKPTGTSRRPSYSAWAGPGCSGGGLYRETARFKDGFNGWYTVSKGGHKGDGCDGSFSAIPMSGSKTTDNDSRATWTWYVGSGYTTCSVAVVVPDTGRDADVAGSPTTYRVLADPEDDESAIKSFEIDQRSLRGRDKVVRKIPVTDQQVAVQMVDRGRNPGRADGETPHHAAAQMRADCRS